MHHANSLLEIVESSCCHHEYITSDKFFITYCVSTQRGSELDSALTQK